MRANPRPRRLIGAALAILVFPGLHAADFQRLGTPFNAQETGAETASRPAVTVQTSQRTRHDHGDPTAAEQLLLEFLNRARATPGSEVARQGFDLNENLDPGTISPTPKQPLAFHPRLIESARAHSAWMLETDIFDHIGKDGSNPHTRMEAAGYPFGGNSWGLGENIGSQGTTGDINLAGFTSDIHDGLVKSQGHRVNIMGEAYDEIGLGILTGTFVSDGMEFNSVMITENFANSGSTPGPLVLGVVYRDADANEFYSIGEGVDNITVQPSRGNAFAITSTSGGFAFPVTGITGDLSVTISGGALTAPITKVVTLRGRNVKVDFDLNKDQPTFIRLESPAIGPGARFELILTGTPGTRTRLQSSTNLRDWTSVLSTTLTTEGFRFVDPNPISQGQKYYRAILDP